MAIELALQSDMPDSATMLSIALRQLSLIRRLDDVANQVLTALVPDQMVQLARDAAAEIRRLESIVDRIHVYAASRESNKWAQDIVMITASGA